MRRIVLVLAVFAVTGCGGAHDSPGAPAPHPTPARMPVTGPIDFTWTGTIAGRDDRLHIEPDGSATLRSRGGTTALELPAPVLARVRRDLEAANLARLATHYGGPPVSDGARQSVTVAGRTVTSDDGGGPAALDTALSDLTDIVANADSLVRFTLGVRTTIGPDLASVSVTDDGVATVITPGSSPETTQLARRDVATLRRALAATPFVADGTPGYVDARAPLDEDHVRLSYRWLTLTDPPASARPALRILKGLVGP